MRTLKCNCYEDFYSNKEIVKTADSFLIGHLEFSHILSDRFSWDALMDIELDEGWEVPPAWAVLLFYSETVNPLPSVAIWTSSYFEGDATNFAHAVDLATGDIFPAKVTSMFNVILYRRLK